MASLIFFFLLLCTPIGIVILVYLWQKLKSKTKLTSEECAVQLHEILSSEESFMYPDDGWCAFLDIKDIILRCEKVDRNFIQKIYFDKYGKRLSDDVYRCLSYSPFSYEIMKLFTD